uniref:Polyprotein n=1 Tax=Leptobrachium leishanense TaxID=445787 RepID=A0A8C5PJ19_9ANUR
MVFRMFSSRIAVLNLSLGWRGFCHQLGVKLSFSSAYHPQTNGLAERTNQTLETYLRCFISDAQDDWVTLLPWAEFAYNNATSQSTKYSPFEIVTGMHPTVFQSSFLPQDIPALEEHLCNLRAIWEKTKMNLESASLAQKRSADCRCRPPPVYHVGDRVWLSTRHIRLKVPSMKFAPRFIGPYRILRCINPVSYALQLPASLRIPNSFHVSLLKPLMCNRFTCPDSLPPPPVVVDGNPEYEVESILDSRRFCNRLQYLVHWKGYGPTDRTWVSSRDVHAPRLVSAFHRRFPDKPAPDRPVGVPRGGGAVMPRRLVWLRRPSPRLRGQRLPRVLSLCFYVSWLDSLTDPEYLVTVYTCAQSLAASNFLRII